ncbi:hypothetical protein MSAN_00300800 [Mycena sanguinolenta]|uniref:Protein kinase domain-containing protein n=1 Tax=Mycena sanguinolenta TaxID=230812 RepID=A0A8H6ZAY9_9AGAR|nr:hypothetical protein MSAN_00300800 [Mycena sanguinolenta]
MPSVFRGPRQSKNVKILKISGGTGGTGGEGGTNGGSGGAGEGPRVKLRIVGGKTITNINQNYSAAPAVPSGFRTIPLGDLDLQREIQLDKYSGVVSVRRLYSGKIHAEGTNVAIALYQGDGAEARWRRDVKNYMAVRHPNIVQLYGTASCGNIHAAVFHDDLIPYRQVMELYEHSHFSTVYIHVFVRTELEEISEYFWTMFEHHLSKYGRTLFIRRSTGRLCLDLVPGDTYLFGDLDTSHSSISTQQGLGFLAGENSEATIIDALPLDHYHEISLREFSTNRYVSIPPSTSVNIGSVLHCPSDDTFDDVVEIAWLPNAELPSFDGWDGSGDWSNFTEPTADGWTRLESNHIMDTTVWLSVNVCNCRLWLSQANHIFTTLQISSDFENYGVIISFARYHFWLTSQTVFVEYIRFELSVSTNEAIPPGFLFLCPPHNFQTGECSFKWPECPAYWSLDPSGTERLTMEEATSLGFPAFQFSTRVDGFSWDASMYAGLRQFHKGKGFDPDSQDVARHLGYELYQMSGQNRTDTLFAHIEEEYSDNNGNEGSTSGHPTNEAPNHDLASPSPRQNVAEEVDSNAVEQIVDSTHTDHVELPPGSAHQDAEEIPLSGTFKFVLNVQLTLMFFSALFWVLSNM